MSSCLLFNRAVNIGRTSTSWRSSRSILWRESSRQLTGPRRLGGTSSSECPSQLFVLNRKNQWSTLCHFSSKPSGSLVADNSKNAGMMSQLEATFPQRNVLQKLGIVNDKIRSTETPVPPRSGGRKKRRRHHHDSSPPLYDQRALARLRPPNSSSIRVKSVHAAQTIDVVRVLSKVFGVSSANPPIRHMFGKTGVFVQLPPPPQHSSSTQEIPHEGVLNHEGGDPVQNVILPSPRFVAVMRFGSVVFFNVPPREAGKLLEEIKKHGTKAISPGFERKEHFEVVVQPQLRDMAHVVNGDYCMVQELDMNCVAVISNIMAQTVALDSYADTVDELLANFASINSTVTQTGNFTEMEKDSLFRVVAQNNSIFIDMISKLGIKDRSDTAWNLSQYERVHEGMKEEFEIDDRFQHIEFKLNMIQQNAKFFVEILHSQKTNSLEWIIIVLISFECVLMCMEMSGLGTAMFASAPFFGTSLPPPPS